MQGLTVRQQFSKRLFDITLAIVGLLLLSWLILLAWILASIDTRSNGFYVQRRVGRNARLFSVIKIKTMRSGAGRNTLVTVADDPRITYSGRLLRATKIDELPQLFHVLIGDMSFVGPRPDVPGFADNLVGDDRVLLTVRPGITGPATLKYRHEEHLLAEQPDPEDYNRNIIYPDKVSINKEYIRNWSLAGDVAYICRTLFAKLV